MVLYARGLYIHLKTTTATTPASVKVPLIGWPGRKNFPCELAGSHDYLMLPAMSYDMSSETGSEPLVASIPLMGMVPDKLSRTEDDNYYSYVFTEFIVFPHRSIFMNAIVSPVFDGTCRLGLGTGSGVWKAFRGGATYCAVENFLAFKPSVVGACLGEKLGRLECNTAGPLWCGAVESSLEINGEDMGDVAVLVSPVGHRIWGGPGTAACAKIQNHFYTGLSVRATVGGLRLHLSDGDIVGEDRFGARLLRNDVVCDHDLVPTNTLVIGIMDTGHSWAYSAEENRLDVHESKSTTMLNTWIDVVVVNVCILAYMHFLSDREKSTTSKVTIIPEILGTLAAATGVFRQQEQGGVYERVADIPLATEACEWFTGAIVAALAAHCASLAIEYDIFQDGKDTKRDKMWVRIRAARNFSHEYSILGSVFLQVCPGISDVYQIYM